MMSSSSSAVCAPAADAVAEWIFPILRPTDPEGRNPIFANFKNEGWQEGQAFVREFLQNTIDNRRKSGQALLKATVSFRTLGAAEGLNANHNRARLEPLEAHLLASGLPAHLRDYDEPRALVVEEFQTTGFGGTYTDSRSDGDFAAFFHGEAHDTKQGGKNGRAGQGKATYNMISAAGALMVLTDRVEDGKRLLMGKALLPRTHTKSKVSTTLIVHSSVGMQVNNLYRLKMRSKLMNLPKLTAFPERQEITAQAS